MTDLELREAVALEVMNLGPTSSKWRVHGTVFNGFGMEDVNKVYDKEVLARSIAGDQLMVSEEKDHRPAYESDISAAWEVVDAMRANGYELLLEWRIRHDDDPSVWVGFREYGGGTTSCVADTYDITVPLAICKAALSTVRTQEAK